MKLFSKQKRQMIIIDNLTNQQFTLVLKCDSTEFNNGNCGIFQFGTFNGILEYQNNIIIKQTIYKPLFDSIVLKKLNPNINEKVKVKLTLSDKKIYPLETLDSILINQMIIHIRFKFGVEYLKVIKGFYLDTIIIRTDKTKKYENFMTI